MIVPQQMKTVAPKINGLSRQLSPKEKGSKDRRKARMRLAKEHAKVANLRNDSLHKLTSDLTQRFDTIVIEDLNVRGMLKNHHLARVVSDMGFFELRRQLDYKAEWYGSKVVVADRWYPSSKTCSTCGFILDALPLDVREWTCECGTKHDRDINAAKNLANLAVSSTVTACGEEGSGFGRQSNVKPASLKQEVSNRHVCT